ncbi:hypothetical protein THOB06_30155 [Vibrio rotiferianus]|nr:hypothetical protein THOG10_30155 [Vibrio rotiferianus]CAH1582799.1 hypothetical protein THOB06_30155 [Vibrio rotiferianus]
MRNGGVSTRNIPARFNLNALKQKTAPSELFFVVSESDIPVLILHLLHKLRSYHHFTSAINFTV